MLRRFALLAALVSVSGCVGGWSGHRIEWVGRTPSDLVSKLGAPDRTTTLPSGVGVYTYSRRDIHGDSICDENYFIAGGKIVGFKEQGTAVNCDEQSGTTG